MLSLSISVSDLVNRGTSTARRMQASLYDWIVYQRRYKAKERKGEKKISVVVGLFKYQEGRQGASSKRANGSVVEYGRSFIRSFCHVAPGPPSSTSAITLPPPSVKPALKLYISILYLWGVLIFILFW